VAERSAQQNHSWRPLRPPGHGRCSRNIYRYTSRAADRRSAPQTVDIDLEDRLPPPLVIKLCHAKPLKSENNPPSNPILLCLRRLWYISRWQRRTRARLYCPLPFLILVTCEYAPHLWNRSSFRVQLPTITSCAFLGASPTT